MVPMKDCNPLEFGDHVKYLPDDHFIGELQNDKVRIDVPNPVGDGKRIYKANRWAYIPVPQNLRPNTRDTDAQHYENHGLATVTS